MTKVAVILSGCGFLDGAEIRESVLSLLYLDEQGAEVSIFAPDIAQMHVIDHLSAVPQEQQSRNVLHEAARIARGDIKPLSALDVSHFDALVVPGGYGVAKNLSSLATQGKDAAVLPEFAAIVQAFHAQHKPIGAICIAPAVLALALRGQGIRLTIGEDADTVALIETTGNIHVPALSAQAVEDDTHKVVSCSAYMRDDSLSEIAKGIRGVIYGVMRFAQANSKAA